MAANNGLWASEEEFSGEDVPMKSSTPKEQEDDDRSVDNTPLMEVLSEQDERKSQAGDASATGSGDKTPKTDSGESASPLMEVLSEKQYSLTEGDPSKEALADPEDFSLQKKVIAEAENNEDNREDDISDGELSENQQIQMSLKEKRHKAEREREASRRIIRLYHESKKVQDELVKNGNDMNSEGFNEYCVRVARMNLDTVDKEGWNPRKLAREERRKAKKEAKGIKVETKVSKNAKKEAARVVLQQEIAEYEARQQSESDFVDLENPQPVEHSENHGCDGGDYPQAQDATVGLITGQAVDLYGERDNKFNPNAKSMEPSPLSVWLWKFFCFVFGACFAVWFIFFILWIVGCFSHKSSRTDANIQDVEDSEYSRIGNYSSAPLRTSTGRSLRGSANMRARRNNQLSMSPY